MYAARKLVCCVLHLIFRPFIIFFYIITFLHFSVPFSGFSREDFRTEEKQHCEYIFYFIFVVSAGYLSEPDPPGP